MKFCRRCGFKLTDGYKFCPKCGADVSSSYNVISTKPTFSDKIKHFFGFGSLSSKSESTSIRDSISASYRASSEANIDKLATSYVDESLANDRYRLAINNKSFYTTENSKNIMIRSTADSFVNRYLSNAASVMSCRVDSMKDIADNTYIQYLSSKSNSSEDYSNSLSIKDQRKSNWNSTNLYAMSFATVSLRNNQFQSAVNHKSYTWDITDRNSVANSMTDTYVEKYSDNAASIISSQTDSLSRALNIFGNKYFASSKSTQASYEASSASSTQVSLVQSKAHEVQIDEARSYYNNSRSECASKYTNGNRKAWYIWNDMIVPDGKYVSHNYILSHNILNKINHVIDFNNHNISLLHTSPKIEQYKVLGIIDKNKSVIAPLFKIAEYQYYTFENVLRLMRINFIRYSCIKPVKISNNEFYRQAQLHIPSLTTKRYRKYPYSKILSKYIFNYSTLKNDIDLINKYLPKRHHIHIPKGLGEFLKRVIALRNDFDRAQKGADGEEEVKNNLENHHVKVIPNVNLPYIYTPQSKDNRNSNQNDIISINNNGVFIFEVKNYNHSNIWVNRYGEIAWGYKKNQHQNQHENPIWLQARNHKKAIIYNIKKYNKHKSYNKQIHLDSKFIHVILVYINDNKAHTHYNFHYIDDLNNSRNRYIDDVRNQDNCYGSIDNLSEYGHIHDDTIRKLEESMNFLKDKPFNHCELVDNYEEVFRIVRFYIEAINKLKNMYDIIFSKHFIKDKKNYYNNILKLSHEIEKHHERLKEYHEANNHHWYKKVNGKIVRWYNTPNAIHREFKRYKRSQFMYKRDQSKLRNKSIIYSKFYRLPVLHYKSNN